MNIVGMGDPKGSPIPVDGSNNYMKDKDGNVVITKLNEEMCQEIAAAAMGRMSVPTTPIQRFVHFKKRSIK